MSQIIELMATKLMEAYPERFAMQYPPAPYIRRGVGVNGNRYYVNNDNDIIEVWEGGNKIGEYPLRYEQYRREADYE